MGRSGPERDVQSALRSGAIWADSSEAYAVLGHERDIEHRGETERVVADLLPVFPSR